MKTLFAVLALLLIACASPNEPIEYNQFAAGDTFPQLSNLPLGGDNWPPEGHWCNNPVVCFICYQSIGARDHDGDGIAEDILKDWMEEGYSLPSEPPVPFQGFPPITGGGEWMPR